MGSQLMGKFALGAVVGMVAGLVACSKGSESVTVAGDVDIAYVKRPVSALGNPTDAVVTGQGGDLYIREKSSPSAPETNVTGSYTQGQGDVSDPEVSYDGTKLLFSMRGPNDARWSIWEYDIARTQLSAIPCDAAVQGDDVDPAYLPDGRIVFASNRQEGTRRQMAAQGITPYTYVDEYEREATTALHVMDGDGTNCHQISFNQSHDRNPTVLRTGEIMFSRWDHVGGRNQFTVFKVNPDGTNLFVVYGAHSPGNSYLHPREMPDGRVMSTAMPLSGTREGGSLEIIDIDNYSDRDAPGTSNPPPNQLGEQAGQFQATRLMFPGRPLSDHEAMRGRGVSPLGRYSTPYPLWDGTGRALVVFTPSQPLQTTNALGQPVTVEDTPRYGIYMLDLDAGTLRPVVLPQDGYYYSDPVAIQSRPVPQVKNDFNPDSTIGAGLGLFDVNTVYDTDRLERMGNSVLASGESIPRATGGAPDIADLKLPGTAAFASRVARFFRITKAVPTPAGLSREVIGETEFEMQQIVGYGVIEPDGSIRAKVPSDTPVTITALDREGRAFTPHTHWIQAREGERRFCKGCHSSRLGTTNPNGGTFLNDPAVVGIHPGGTSTTTMAQTRAADPNYANLQRDPSYADFWTTQYSAGATPESPITLAYGAGATPAIKGPASCSTTWSAKDCAIVINYVDHVQPILSAKCTSCHNGTSDGGGLDLSDTMAGAFGRVTSYQELLVGDPLLDANGQPIITINDDGEVRIERESPPVEPGSARGSRLIERIFEQPLKASVSNTTRRAFCRAAGVSCFNGATWTDHSGFTSASERRLISEWTDLGAQYYNDAFDGSGNVRSAAAQLSESAFASQVQPVLQASCASCHQPSNGAFTANRFVLTGNTRADFSATASMVTNLSAPDSSLLLFRPSRSAADTPPHPGVTPVLPVGSANYCTLRSWIAPALACP
jgi:Hydrazine synthase alpha subunit middle domain/WD40-like Beta Propeller Repeat